MASIASPYGLRPVNLIGGQSFNGGAARTYEAIADTTAFYVGDIIELTAAGLPQRRTTTPVAINIPTTSTNATAGVMGVCVGVSYVDPVLKYQVFAQYLPANAFTAGYRNISILVNDDPNQIYQIQGSAALGTFNSGTGGSGWRGAVGKNAALSWGGSPNTTLGLSDISLLVGANGGSLLATSTLAMRIVDVVRGTQTDAFPEFLVKFNVGVQSYTNPLGV
jgi:hypothetical protein